MDEMRAADDAQAALWNGVGGEGWVEAQALLDRMFKPFEDRLVEAVVAGSARRVLDVGCGTGGMTLAVARALGAAGRVVGVDISAPMIAAANSRAERARAGENGTSASFLRADAGAYAFEPAAFDSIVSRFGVMFFDDSVRAFTNLRRAAKAGAELRFIAWRRPEENPFMTTAERAAAPLLPALPARRPDAPGQFAFADADRVSRILAESGWTGIDIQATDVPCTLPTTELERYLTLLGPVSRALRDVDARKRAEVIKTALAAFEPFVRGAEVRFTAACWMVGALRS